MSIRKDMSYVEISVQIDELKELQLLLIDEYNDNRWVNYKRAISVFNTLKQVETEMFALECILDHELMRC
jgi:hypothetical protein